MQAATGHRSTISTKASDVEETGSSFPRFAVPCEDSIQERDDVRAEDAEQAVAFLRRGKLRTADVAGCCAILRHPRAMRRFEIVAEWNRRQILPLAHKVRLNPQDHRIFPFAGMTHLRLR